MSEHPHRQAPPALTRRAAVAGLVVGLTGVAGCDPDRGGSPSSSGVSTDGSTGVSTGSDPDSALVDRVTGQVSELLALVTAVEQGFPSLAARVRPFRELHAAHLDALDASPTAPAAGPGAASGLHTPRAALRAVLDREQTGRRRLADAAIAAESGILARLLASMSAGVAQQLAVSTSDRTTGGAV